MQYVISVLKKERIPFGKLRKVVPIRYFALIDEREDFIVIINNYLKSYKKSECEIERAMYSFKLKNLCSYLSELDTLVEKVLEEHC